jgi:antitoxin ParD1/3/4
MTITLRPDQEQLLQDILRTGGYENAEEAIGSALEILHSQNQWLSETSSLVDARIQEGIAQSDRAEGIPETELAGYLGRLKAQQD